MKNIMFVASECRPFSKSGGLADVIGSLPQALVESGAQVSVCLPLYKNIIESAFYPQMEEVMVYETEVGWRKQYTRVMRLDYEKVTYYFFDNLYYFNREELYGYIDDVERFIFFSNAVIEFIYHSNVALDILHCHDWQAGIAAAIAKIKQPINNLKVVFSVHNIKYQGWFEHDGFSDMLNLGREHFDGFEWQGMLNAMKAALFHADIITTVSETYADEIKSAYYGEGLDPIIVMREHDLYGVLNGLDIKSYNSRTDKHIHKNYRSSRKSKMLNKIYLQNKLALNINENVPMYGLVTRLVEQKGIDLIRPIMHEFLRDTNAQFVMIGTGEKEYESYFKTLEHDFRDQVRSIIGFSEEMSREIYAACDFFIMPSKFEPCGLGQMIAMRYLCAPIVRETGGLKDTVTAYNEFEMTGNGLSFSNYNAHELLETLLYSHQLFYRVEDIEALFNGMLQSDFSWTKSAEKYLELYQL